MVVVCVCVSCLSIANATCVLLPGVVHDGVEAVSDGQDGAVFKLGADGGLDQVVCLHVHSSRGLVQDQDLGLSQESSGQTHQLALAQAGQTHRQTVRTVREGGGRRPQVNL